VIAQRTRQNGECEQELDSGVAIGGSGGLLCRTEGARKSHKTGDREQGVTKTTKNSTEGEKSSVREHNKKAVKYRPPSWKLRKESAKDEQRGKVNRMLQRRNC